MDELDFVVNCKSHKGSSPGLSGFSYCALQAIYPAIKYILLAFVNSNKGKEMLCNQLRLRKIIFINKPGKDSKSVSGYWPIVLLEILYIAERLKDAMGHVMTVHQNAYQAGKSCSITARTILDTKNLLLKRGVDSSMISLDFSSVLI